MDGVRKCKPGDRVYIVANNITIKELEIISVQGDYCTLRDLGRYGGMRLRKNRLFANKDEAYQELNKHKGNSDSGYIRPY